MGPFSLYIHIPYCLNKCSYCDFNSYAVSDIPEKEYVTALLAELDYRLSRPEWQRREIKSIYFGGGTPSLFSSVAFHKIISTICKIAPVHDLVEITIESNPCTLSVEKLESYLEAGINRLSIGAQSFIQENLNVLGRIHTAEHAESAFEIARVAGFSNISLDLMYGIPGQTLSTLKQDLGTLTSLKPDHVSAYGLTLESRTPLYQKVKKGELEVPGENLALDMFDTVNQILSKAGFNHYEISNFARPGKEARHNLTYWDADDYLSLGAGAHSFYHTGDSVSDLLGYRWMNVTDPGDYITKACNKGQAEKKEEKLSAEDMLFEYFLLGLRKMSGFSRKDFSERFGAGVEEIYPLTLKVLEEEGFLSVTGDRVALSAKGLPVADTVIQNFVTPERSLSLHMADKTENRRISL